jgi:hypothetical protein
LLQDERDKHSATQTQLTIAGAATRKLKPQLEDSIFSASVSEVALLEEKKVSNTTMIELTARTKELEAIKKASNEAKIKQAKELEIAKKEAATAMNTIRDELKKVKDAGARKRQASEDAGEVLGKKIKKGQ